MRCCLYMLVVVMMLTNLFGCTTGAYKVTPVPADRSLDESVVYDDKGVFLPKIALIDVDGILINRPKPGLLRDGEHPVSLLTEKLDKAAEDDAVKAVILRINSPGGTVTASEIMYNEVLHFKEVTNHKKPVFAVMMDVAASGGYYIACAADEIWAHPTTITCSIGVIMQFVNFEGTMYKIGVEANTIKSVPMKDAGSPLRQMKQEERELFQYLVEQFHEQFVAAVAKGRDGLTEEDVRQIADGAICSAEQARELGLIDKIGTLRDVIAAIKTQLAAERVRVIAYHRPLGYKPNVYAHQPASPPQMNVFNIDLPAGWVSTTPSFMYLWVPGF